MKYSEIVTKHVWIAKAPKDAGKILLSGLSPNDTVFSSPEKARTTYESLNDVSEDETVILEFKEKDGQYTFHRVYSGVIDDALTDQIKNHHLDEVALFGLRRCTAVTANALLKHYGKRPILLGDVPETDVGVLQILSKGGLVYKPAIGAAGRTVQQFANLNQRGAWYIVTPGHAMALIQGQLFDAENRGPDSRKIIQAYQIGRR